MPYAALARLGIHASAKNPASQCQRYTSHRHALPVDCPSCPVQLNCKQSNTHSRLAPPRPRQCIPRFPPLRLVRRLPEELCRVIAHLRLEGRHQTTLNKSGSTVKSLKAVARRCYQPGTRRVEIYVEFIRFDPVADTRAIGQGIYEASYRRGNTTRKTVPFPLPVSSSRLASNNSHSRLTIDSPIPSPGVSSVDR